MFKYHNVLILTICAFYFIFGESVMRSLPLGIYYEYGEPGDIPKIKYDLKTGLPQAVNIKAMKNAGNHFSYEHWLSGQNKKAFSKTEARESLYNYMYDSLVIHNMYRKKGDFNTIIEHKYGFFCAKVVKDMIWKSGKETFTRKEIRQIFFKQNAILSNVNTLIIKTRNYILTHPVHINN